MTNDFLNASTWTCRIPPEILGHIFLHYQLSSSSFNFPSQNNKEGYSPLCSTALWWVPAVAHVCRHWRSVALGHPWLWSKIELYLGRTCAENMLTLSGAVPITVSMCDPHPPCKSRMMALDWGQHPKRGPPKVDPLGVLVDHLFHIRDLELGACPCTACLWAVPLKTASPLLETFWLRVKPHQSRSLPNTPIALPDNFLATHPRLRQVVLENAFLSSWDLGPQPLAQLASLTIIAPDPRYDTDYYLASTLPTREQFLDFLKLMPALQELHLENCLPDVAPTYLPRTISLPHLRTLIVRDHVNRCYEVLTQLDIPPVTKIKACCWSLLRCSVLECLRILPLLATHLSRTYPEISTSQGRGIGGPQALTVSSATRDNGRTLFVMSAWREFSLLTSAEGRYDGPKGDPDVQLECEWDARNLELEHRALSRACAGVSLAELRVLSLQAGDGAWSPDDWYNTFASCPKITHVLAHDAAAESLLDALHPSTVTTTDTGVDTKWTTNSNDNSTTHERYGEPLFPGLVSLTLAKVDFTSACANPTAWGGLLKAMEWRKTNPVSVTSLDRLELRECTVAAEKVESLRAFASVVVVGSDHRRS
jgi:hypothetical protein